jgi:tRNA G46 methylase TrmB
MIRKAEIFEAFFGVYNLSDHFVINCFDQSSVIVDLGAGKGEFSDSILRRFPCCRIILLEPTSSLVQELSKKFENQKKS